MRMIISASLMSVVLAVSQAAVAQTTDSSQPSTVPGAPVDAQMGSPSMSAPASESGMQPSGSQMTGDAQSLQSGDAQQQANVNTSECDISFNSGASSADTAAVQSCVSQLDKSQVKYISVMGVASPDGPATKNQQLSQMRAASVAEQLKREFPNARVTSMGIGEQPNMDPSARVTIVSVDDAAAQAQASVPLTPAPVDPLATQPLPGEQNAADDLGRVSLGEGVETEGAVRMNTARIAARLAQDDFDAADDLLPFYGLEVAYVGRLPGATGLRWEAGAVGGVMAEETDEADGYQAHGLLGVGYAFNNFVIGARGLGGAIWDDRPGTRRDAQEDFGGEARIGFEKDRWSVFAGAGATENLSTRLGIDLGILL